MVIHKMSYKYSLEINELRGGNVPHCHLFCTSTCVSLKTAIETF